MKYLFLVFALTLASSCLPTKGDRAKGDTFDVERGSVSSQIQFNGRIRSENTVLVRVPFDAHLVSLEISLGQKVEQNQIIALIAKPEESTNVGEIIQKKGQLEQLKFRHEQLKLQIESNQKEVERLDRLVKSGSIAAGERDRLKTSAALEAKELKIIKSQIATTNDEIRHLKKQESTSSRTLRAPIAGTVTELWTDEANITPGMSIGKDTAIAIIETFGTYTLKAHVTEPDYIRMEVGQKVEVNLAYSSSSRWIGQIKSLSPIYDANSSGVGRFQVNVVFPDKGSEIKTGLEGIGKINLQHAQNVLRVPRSAIFFSEGAHYVSFPSDQGVQQHQIEIGLVGDQFVEVKSGLNEGSLIYASYVYE